MTDVAQIRHGLEEVVGAVALARRKVGEGQLVDLSGLWFGPQLVRNDPFLENRPKVMGLQMLTPDQIRALCAGYSIAVVDYYDLAEFGVTPAASPAVGRFSVTAPDRGLRAIATGPRCNSG